MVLFLESLKAKDAHVGAVKNLSPPSAPQAPALPSDLASELAAYDAAEPTRADAPAKATSSPEETSGGAQEFLEFLEKDLPKSEAHH